MKIAKLYVSNNGWLSGFVREKGSNAEFYFSLDITKAMPLDFSGESEQCKKNRIMLQLLYLQYENLIACFWENTKE